MASTTTASPTPTPTMLHPCRRLRRSFAIIPIILTIALLSNNLYAQAANVKWTGNDNVAPEHEAAHTAPRSQKYWDEHGIERPDYAKTDAEIAAERRKNGEGGGLFGIILIILVFLGMMAVLFANLTGEWDMILNNPVGGFIADCINRITEIAGIRGHKLGGSSKTTAAPKSTGLNDEEARRLARLARFENPKNMLDSMKAE